MNIIMNRFFRKKSNFTFYVSRNKFELLVCFFTAIGIITICSKSSFLYPLNDWVDSNCFFTVGKSMMNGLVVYRDLFEQKGPLLYFMHGVAWLISKDSFLGVYLIEIVAAFFFLYFSFLTVREVVPKISPVVVPVMAMLVYTTASFAHGDSAEELCLPFLAYAAWLGTRALIRQEEICLKDYFMIGMTSACVFWIKFNVTGFYLGWFLVPAFLLMRDKRWKYLWKVIFAIVAGVFLVTLPFVIYFGVNGAIGDWLQVYFIDNIFTYSVSTETSVTTSIITNFKAGLKSIRINNFAAFSSLALSVLMFTKKRYLLIGFQMYASAGALILATYISGRMHVYYAMAFSVFLSYGVMVVMVAWNMIESSYNELTQFLQDKIMVFVILIVCMVGSFTMTQNRYLLGVDRSELPQYQFKEIIEQEESPTLLNYGFLDGGFYTVCNIVPNCKAFCTLNNPITEMFDLQDYYVREGLCDFVVTRGKECDSEKYELVAKSSYMFEDIMFNYYLYKLK